MPNMSNNTSLYDYYNYDNFKVEHAPNNFAAQPKRLLPEQINMNISKDKDGDANDILRKEANINDVIKKLFSRPITNEFS